MFVVLALPEGNRLLDRHRKEFATEAFRSVPVIEPSEFQDRHPSPFPSALQPQRLGRISQPQLLHFGKPARKVCQELGLDLALHPPRRGDTRHRETGGRLRPGSRAARITAHHQWDPA